MIPTFIDYNEIEQCAELREYFADLGAEIKRESDYAGDEQLLKNLQEIISVLDVCVTKEQPHNVERVLNSIVSLLIQVPHTNPSCQTLISSFLERILASVNEHTALVCLRVLQNLFEGLGSNSLLKYEVYTTLLQIAGRCNRLSLVYDDIPKLSSWLNVETVGIEKVQKLYRLLQKLLLQNKQSEQASKVMIELLGTYTAENASNAREDAHKCIVSFIQDPNTFLMDHLLTLKPVKILEGEPIHDLLTIFVAEKFTGYLQFYEKNKTFVESLGLSHEANLQKMRLLTFMQLAETKKELHFEEIASELQIELDNVEIFIVDVLRTKLVKAKIDQVNQKVIVTSTMHRTFGKPQWRHLRDTLVQWQSNIERVQKTLSTAIRSNPISQY